MKKLLYTSLFLLFALSIAKAQPYNMQNHNGQIIITCGADFYDNASGNYSNNVNQTITFKSNHPINTHIRMSFNTFKVDNSDTLYVYDGPTTSSPLIGKYNNSNPLTGGQNVVESSIYNNTGELTFQFKTNASVVNDGWFASLVCIPQCQRIIAKVDSSLTTPHPADSNFIDICPGVPVTFHGSADFIQNNVLYHQSLAGSKFQWNFGDGTIDTGMVITHNFTQIRGYDIQLKVTDSIGCTSSNAIYTRVRVSSNPIRNLNLLNEMCSHPDVPVEIKAGTPTFSNIVLKPYTYTQNSSESFDSTMFIPDGPNCAVQCYNTNVTFNQFLPGATIQSANDIISICVNMEHSFAGDLGFKIHCPNGQTVILDPNTHSGGAYLGEPYGGGNHSNFDNGCDPANNPHGTGWTYCWSEIYTTAATQTFDQLSSSVSGTIDSTNQILHTNYIKPQNTLAGLIGCPLNGMWNIEICDDYGADNGYIFNWTLNLAANLLPIQWTYSVGIDSVAYTGPFITGTTDTSAFVVPTQGGTFPYNVSVIDDFGCHWDTTISLTVIPKPVVNLGNDTVVCSGTILTLDAGNPGATYEWQPYGETTQTIQTFNSPVGALIDYIVTVSQSSGSLTCKSADTLVLTIHEKPNISYLLNPSQIPLTGCEPVTVSISDESTPDTEINYYSWDFGDGTVSNDKNPTHTYMAGTFNLKVNMKTVYGCESTQDVTPFAIVFPQPVADFNWTPTVATITNPIVNFFNLTQPNVGSNYVWDFGDAQTSTDVNPVHTFNAINSYTVTLYATNSNGCNDTISKVIKVVNDILDFPNVITPNGDGKNDFFEISGLLDGGFTKTNLSVYNRWGKKILDADNYQNNWNGEDAPDGVYYFVFKGVNYVNREIEFKGSLTILRSK